MQEQLDLEIKRRTQLEEALKATGASSEQVRAITGKHEFKVEGKKCKKTSAACSAEIIQSRDGETIRIPESLLSSSFPRRGSLHRVPRG